MAYTDFYNDFKRGIIGDILFFCGDEDYLMDWATDLLVTESVSEEYRHLDVLHLDGSICSAAEIMGNARTYSMFSDKRVIIVDDYVPTFKKQNDSDSNELLEFCKGKQSSAILVFRISSGNSENINAYGKKLQAACNYYEFARLDRAGLKSFINKRVNAAGKIINRRELDYLIELSGYYNKDSRYSLTDMDGDLLKLTRACEGDTVDSKLIEELLIGDEDRFTFHLIDAMMEHDSAAAMDLTEAILQEADGPFAILATVRKQFEIMYDAIELERMGMSIKEMASLTGVNEFRFKKAFQAARGFNKDIIREKLIQLYNIDRDIKTGNIDPNLAFELFTATL